MISFLHELFQYARSENTLNGHIESVYEGKKPFKYNICKCISHVCMCFRDHHGEVALKGPICF